MNYYNENDPKASAWLRELISAGEIPVGVVDTRSIKEVQPHEIEKYTQCHFFAGIGGWSLALKLAGWPEDRKVWTGSCPCQPFSAAGKGLGISDERHLWHEFLRLISKRGPATVFGEQVASKAGKIWFSGIRADLETLGYVVGGADLCAAGVGAPHIRQRLFWVGDSHSSGLQERAGGRGVQQIALESLQGETSVGAGNFGGLADSDGRDAGPQREQRGGKQRLFAQDGGISRMDDPERDAGKSGRFANQSSKSFGTQATRSSIESGRCRDSCWDDFDVLPCLDGKSRRVESGTFPLAHGISGRMGKLRGYGNAIVPQLAAEFIGGYMDITE